MNTLASNPTPRAPVFQSSISGFSVYYAGKARKFGMNKAAAQAFMATCRAPVVNTSTEAEYEAHLEAINTEPQSPEQQEANAPTTREMLDILSAENAELREQFKMVKQLNNKLYDAQMKHLGDTETSNIGFDVRGQLKMLASAPRRNDATYKRAIAALQGIATDLVNG